MKPTVAVVGIHGMLGQDVLDTITSKTFRDEYTFPIHALSTTGYRDLPRNTDDINYYSVSFENPQTIDPALIGVDVVINLTGKDVDSSALIDASVRSGVNVYFSSDYGIDATDDFYEEHRSMKLQNNQYAKCQNFARVVQIVCGFFTEWAVENVEELIGIRNGNKLEIAGEHSEQIRISMTTVSDVAKSIASLASRAPSRLPQTIRIHGDCVSCGEIASAFELYNDLKLERCPIQSDLDIYRQQLYHPQQPLDMTLKTQNEVVNPGIWKWTTFQELAKQRWEVALHRPLMAAL